MSKNNGKKIQSLDKPGDNEQDIEVAAEPEVEENKSKKKLKKIKTVKLNEDIGQDQNQSIDDPKLYQLPSLVQFDYLKDTYPTKVLNLPQEQQDITNLFYEYLKENILKYDISQGIFQGERFIFTLPSSIFEGYQNPVIQYVEQKEVRYEKKSISKLSADQLNMIRKTGNFEVKSDIYPIPYVWKLHPLIVKGTEEILKSCHQDLAFVYSGLYLYRDLKDEILKELKYIKQFVQGLSNLLIGHRTMNDDYTYVQIEEWMDKKRQFEIYNKYVKQLTLDFFIFATCSDITIVDDHEGQRRRNSIEQQRSLLIDGIQSTFNSGKKLQEKQIKSEVEKLCQNEKENKIEEKIYSEERKLWFKYLNSHIDSSQILAPVKDHLKELQDSYEIIQSEQDAYNTFIQQKTLELDDQLKRDHKIRYYSLPWKRDAMKFKLKPYALERTVVKQQNIISQLTNKTSKILYTEHTKYMEKFDETFKKEKQERVSKCTQPKRIFYTLKYLLPPYKKVNNSQDWSLVRTQCYETHTNVFLWKWRLMAIRYYVWSVNIAIVLYHNAINCQFGLKALFKTQKFHNNVDIDCITGEIVPKNEVTPYFVVLRNVIQGINRSRKSFEAQPDTGFFGKNFSRIFNYVECYIFRLAVFIMVLILMPLIILLNFSISIGFSFTSFAWIPFAQILRILINVLIFDFDRADRYTNQFFPLANLSVKLVWKTGIKTLFYVFYGLIIGPLMMLVLFLYSIIRYFLANIFDILMFFLVSRLAREPVDDSKAARRVAGIGISRQFYHSIDKGDFLILLQGQLEQCELDIYKKQIDQKIMIPKYNATKILDNIFGVLNAYSSTPSQITKSTEQLQELLGKQLEKRQNKFPKIDFQQLQKVRFTQEELNIYVPLSEQIITSFLEKRHMMHKAYDYFHQDRDAPINQLIELIIKKAVNENVKFNIKKKQILEPLEDIDSRFTINRQKDDLGMKSVINAITGQIDLSKYNTKLQQKFRKQKKNALDGFVVLFQIYDLARSGFKRGEFEQREYDWRIKSLFLDTTYLNSTKKSVDEVPPSSDLKKSKIEDSQSPDDKKQMKEDSKSPDLKKQKREKKIDLEKKKKQ